MHVTLYNCILPTRVTFVLFVGEYYVVQHFRQGGRVGIFKSIASIGGPMVSWYFPGSFVCILSQRAVQLKSIISVYVTLPYVTDIFLFLTVEKYNTENLKSI